MNQKFLSLHKLINKSRCLQFSFLIFSIFCLMTQIYGQNDFISGSTGADGELAPTANQTIQLPESGVFNFTTINIPSGVTIKFTPNSQNTPITLLATGNVTIAGSIVVDGENGFTTGMGGRGGPGGFRGGESGLTIDSFPGKTGDGPGGGGFGGSVNGTNHGGGGGGGYSVPGNNGHPNGNPNYLIGSGGPTYGTSSLLPLMGGSGGGGGGASVTYRGGSGGGGGGAILIASSGTITLSGSITSKGGNGALTPAGGGGGGGSGGAIRLISNIITGTGAIDARGGAAGSIQYGGSPGGGGARGYIRVETYNYSTFNPNLYTVPINITYPNPITIPNMPQLRITQIGGIPVPLTTKGSLQSAPDVTIPTAQTNPVTIQIEASNVPLDSIVQVIVTPTSGSRTTFQSTALSGSINNSTATANVNLPSGMSVITATLTVNLQMAGLMPMFINGEKITRMEVASTLGGEAETIYITKTGKRLNFSAFVR